MAESSTALISRLVIHSKHNGFRTKEQKAVLPGWAYGRWAAAPHGLLSIGTSSSPLVRQGCKSVNDTDNRTDFARAIRSMRTIILIFIMCDLALAWFAARELLQAASGDPKRVDFCLSHELRSTAR